MTRETTTNGGHGLRFRFAPPAADYAGDMPSILIIDDEQSVRALLKRILIAEFDAEVTEASDGLQALEQLLTLNTSLVILDLHMPVMDGVETLEAIRRSPRLHSVPIAVMTAARDEVLVKRVIKLGVSDFLLKPLRRDTVIERLTRLLGSGMPGHQGRPARLLDLEEGADVLVVDGAAEFRQFFRRQLGGRYAIREAENGVEALRQCLDTPPHAVFVSADIEVLDAEMLARKLRTDPKLRSLAVIALSPEHARHALPGRTLYDGILTRTFVEETFEASFQALLAAGHRPSLVAEGSPAVRQLVAAASQMCSLLLQTDASIDEQTTVRDTSSRRWCTAAVEVQARQEAVDVRVIASLEDARSLAASRFGVDARLLGEDRVIDNVRDIAATLSETFSHALARRGVSCGCGTARVGIVTSVGIPPSASLESFQFSLSASEAQLMVRLDRLSGGDAPRRAADDVEASR